MTTSSTAKRTFIAGILVGVLGLVGMLLGTQLITSLHDNTSVPDDGYFLLNSVISAVISFCLPFSAALIAASLVMRHAESLNSGDRDLAGTKDTRH